jgi:hypothetical protein
MVYTGRQLSVWLWSGHRWNALDKYLARASGMAFQLACTKSEEEPDFRSNYFGRLKTIKRPMYGRAGFQLLRARVLPLTTLAHVHQE